MRFKVFLSPPQAKFLGVVAFLVLRIPLNCPKSVLRGGGGILSWNTPDASLESSQGDVEFVLHGLEMEGDISGCVILS